MQNQLITLLEGQHALLNTLQEGYDYSRDYPEGVAEMRRIMDAHAGPLYIIDDVRAVRLTLDELVAAANSGSRGESPLWHHPKMLGIYFITTDPTIKMAVSGIKSEAFGKVHARVCGTVEEALMEIAAVMAT